MIRKTIRRAFWIAGIVCLATTASAAPKPGDSILPLSATLRFEKSPGDHSAQRFVDQIKIGWPATVRKVNGQWLQIRDEGGYTLPGTKPAEGWVRKDEVVMLGSALENYTDLITKTEAALAAARSNSTTCETTKETLARLFWLRGIYWETGDPKSLGPQPQIALNDFKEATCLDGKLADSWLRQGRNLAQMHTIESMAEWVRCFMNASGHFSCKNAPRKTAAATRDACMKTTHANRLGPSPAPAAVGEALPPPTECSAVWIEYFKCSPFCPPQLYLELGLAYSIRSDASGVLAEAAKEEVAQAEAQADEAKKAVSARMKSYKRASRCFQKLSNSHRNAAEAAKTEHAHGKAKASARKARLAEKEAELAVKEAEFAVKDAALAYKEAKLAHMDAERKHKKAERRYAKAECEYKAYFEAAVTYFQWAECSNPNWFRPASAQGDLYLARVKNSVDRGWGGRPKNEISFDDLFEAVNSYERSIRLSDKSYDALRGRADALRLLAISKLKPAKSLPDDWRFRYIVPTNRDPKQDAKEHKHKADDPEQKARRKTRNWRHENQNEWHENQNEWHENQNKWHENQDGWRENQNGWHENHNGRHKKQNGLDEKGWRRELIPDSNKRMCWRLEKYADDWKQKAQDALLDAAYESARAASTITKDRNSKNLETRAYVQIARAFMTNSMNVSVEYIAQASETLKDALVYSSSTTESRKLNVGISDVNTGTPWLLANFVAETDVDFETTLLEAREMKRGVDRLWQELMSLDLHDYKIMVDDYKVLATLIAMAHRAIDEIEEIEEIRSVANAETKKDIWQLISSLFGLTIPSDNGPLAKNKTASGAQPWPNNSIPVRSELVSRTARIETWSLNLQRLKEEIKRVLGDNGRTCPVYCELRRCACDWKLFRYRDRK